jgi:hypothetical protein
MPSRFLRGIFAGGAAPAQRGHRTFYGRRLGTLADGSNGVDIFADAGGSLTHTIACSLFIRVPRAAAENR